MDEGELENASGKKIFFLYPQTFVKNQVVSELVQEEFEVYTAKDESKLKRALKKYPDSIVFVSINEALKEDVWEKWIDGVISHPETSGVCVGVISLTEDDKLKKKYTEKIKIQCGFIVIRNDLPLFVKTIAEILNHVNAKGRRKYIRTMLDKDANATINVPQDGGGGYMDGVIKDISSVGFSCVFTNNPVLPKNSLLANIQIRLQSQLLKVEGIILGSRIEEGKTIYVIIFTQRVDPGMKSKIRKYIYTVLQSRMDHELR